MSTVITVENLGKRYTLHHQQREQYTALRDVIADGFRGFGRRFTQVFNQSPVPSPQSPFLEDFWALNDVSFEVKQGDRIGIIGRNGAGKSTLLKILSRITEPTTGSIRIKGRVASLLEVGTGFHPELTGRENIFLNGAILGMGRVEIKKKFDEIVDFAEIEKFLDTPVKRYSSGMYVRLAFAVAAHLEPEILIVDEVLAVGDVQFQKKCLGRMEQVGREGRTVLFVSHNLESVRQLCSKGLLLDKSELALAGDIEHVVRQYEKRSLNMFETDQPLNSLYLNRKVNESLFDVVSVSLSSMSNTPIAAVRTFESFKVDIQFHAPERCDHKTAALFITTLSGVTLLRCAMHPYTSFQMTFSKGVNRITCAMERLPLPAGTYVLSFAICDSHSGQWILDQEVCLLEVGMSDVYQCGFPPQEKHAAAVVQYHWEATDV